MFKATTTIGDVQTDSHEVRHITHTRDGITSIYVEHYMGGEQVYLGTSHDFPLALGIDFEQAERLVMELPEYAEAETEQSLMERMRAMLTPEQLAELGLGE